MNVNTIVIKQDTAIAKVQSIRRLAAKQRTEEDAKLFTLYEAVAKRGCRVIDVAAAFRSTGLNELGQPKLALAKADWKDCHLSCWPSRNTVSFNSQRWGNKKHITLPDGVFETGMLQNLGSFVPVPYIPAGVRPKFKLSNYHILFEVEKWETYPVDPFLLRHVTGNLYLVEAEWELTELEAGLLGSMRSGN